MKLTRAEFEKRYAENALRIALVGMSNIGKSYTAMRLAAEFDFELIEVDKLIWESLGQSSMADFAAWQGQPYSDGYAAREAKSIAMESEATSKALEHPTGNAILDTTGSIIYTAPEVRERLISDWYIVHISASSDDLDRLKRQYFEHPKPLIWNGHYTQNPGQDKDEAILESYPRLLASRSKAYAKIRNIEIKSEVILDPKNSIQVIFDKLKPPS